MRPCVVRQGGIALGRQILRGHRVRRPVDEVRRVARLPEAVQEHHTRPARGRRRPDRLEVADGDLHAVAHRHLRVDLGEIGRPGMAGGKEEERGRNHE